MKTLSLKNKCELLPNETYSICLRGAKKFHIYKYIKLFLDLGDGVSRKIGEAQIVSRQHFVFTDLAAGDICDNYYADARTWQSFVASMDNIYSGFDHREIITILKFKMNS